MLRKKLLSLMVESIFVFWTMQEIWI